MATDEIYGTLVKIAQGDLALFEKVTDEFVQAANNTAKPIDSKQKPPKKEKSQPSRSS